MNLDRLSTGEKLLGASGLLLFLSSFLGYWIKAEGGGVTVRGNAWDGYGFFLKLALILALAAAVLVVARAANANLTLPWSNVYRGIAGATLALVGITLLVGPAELEGFAVEISRGILLFVGTLLAVLMVAGAWMHSEEPAATTAAPGPAAT